MFVAVVKQEIKDKTRFIRHADADLTVEHFWKELGTTNSMNMETVTPHLRMRGPRISSRYTIVVVGHR